MIDHNRLRASSVRLRRSIASPTSAALAYTGLCLVGVLFAVCLALMPDRVLERVSELGRLF